MTLKAKIQRAPITSILVASFILLFLIQGLTGVDITSPSTMALVDWGANIFPLTMVEEPWRLLTSGFLHIGINHLLLNVFAAFIFGMVAEPLFGRWYFLSIFLLSILGGGLLNSYTTWQNLLSGGQYAIAAGASGGIMGLGGALMLAALCKLPLAGTTLNARNLSVLMGINLAYGFWVSDIDNAGHIGGTVTGVILAGGYIFALKQKQYGVWLKCATVISVTAAFTAYWYTLHNEVIVAVTGSR